MGCSPSPSEVPFCRMLVLIVEVLVCVPCVSWAASEVSEVWVEERVELPSKLSFEVCDCELLIVWVCFMGTCRLSLIPMLARPSNWVGLGGPSRCSTPAF